MEKETSVIIPAYNEEDRILSTIDEIKKIKEILEIIVIDDGSTDKTYSVIKNSGVRVIRQKKRLGKGEAINRGIRECRGEIILMIDADLGETAVEAKKLILPVIEGRADMAVAKFKKPKKKGGFGLVKFLAKSGIKILTGKSFNYPLSGQRALKKEVIEKIGGLEKGFGCEVALTIDALRSGFKILEIETDMTHRETGRSLRDFLHRGRQFIDVGKVLIKKFINI